MEDATVSVLYRGGRVDAFVRAIKSRKTAMPRDQQFEIPEELRRLAEENVERARKLYLQFMEGVSQAMGV